MAAPTLRCRRLWLGHTTIHALRSSICRGTSAIRAPQPPDWITPRAMPVVLLDADLQDPLAVIHQMIDRYCEGYDVVYGQRVSRQGESGFKRFTAWVFYRLMSKFVYKDLACRCRRLPPDFPELSRRITATAGDASLSAWNGRLGRAIRRSGCSSSAHRAWRVKPSIPCAR